ncbi:hypothetical protein ACIBCU_36865 [Streptomyces sp. NPDC051064]
MSLPWISWRGGASLAAAQSSPPRREWSKRWTVLSPGRRAL